MTENVGTSSNFHVSPTFDADDHLQSDFFLEAMKRKMREGEGEDEKVTFHKLEDFLPLYKVE